MYRTDTRYNNKLLEIDAKANGDSSAERDQNWMDALPDATRAIGGIRQLMHESHHLNDNVTA